MKKIIFSAIAVWLSLATVSAQNSQWYLLDTTDSTIGISVDKTYKELLANRKSTPVVVAVIDGGVDTAHADLKRVLWKNPREIPGNRKDDDGNGYVDDVHGWSFLGGKDGRNINYETAEVTRIYTRLKPLYADKDRKTLTPAQQQEYDLYLKTKDEVLKNQAQYKAQYDGIKGFYTQFTTAVDMVKKNLKTDKLTEANLTQALATTTDASLKRPITALLAIMQQQNVTDVEAIQKELEQYNDQLKARAEYNYNPEYNPRDIVGDRPDDMKQRDYGNPDVTGPDAGHGTHVAGIIAADRTNNLGINGIADNVQIMSVRAVPNGDERDKDVANAIRYAVDNGAQIINMSFGKDYSPNRQTVEEAIQYALSKGVLLVHAAGNDGKNIDTAASYPAARFLDGKTIPNIITVGASAKPNTAALVASFSNYGKETVDVFAPGFDIYSTVPGNEYQNNSGTSMASPVVAGMAAVLKSYFPKLTYTDLKRIIVQSAHPYHNKVLRPESDEEVDFATLSRTGGVVNLYDAVKMALAEEAKASAGGK